MTQAQAHPVMHRLLLDLERLGRRARWLLVARAVAVGLGSIVGGIALVAALDWMVRFPGWLRLGLLVGLSVAIVGWLRRLFGPALAFRPTAIDLALRIERSEPAMAGRLASGVEFAASGLDGSSPFAHRTVEDVASRVAGVSVLGALRPSRPLASMAPALAGLTVALALTIAFPHLSSIAVRRVLLPFGSAAWPARTAVESLLGEAVHRPKGEAVVLAARLVRGDDAGARVTARVRSRRGDSFGAAEDLVLTRQPDGRYERVLEGDPLRDAIEVSFVASDSESEPTVLEFIPRPAIAASRLMATPPAYAAGAVEAIERDLGDGTDERATVREPLLAGSAVTLEIELDRPLPPPEEAATGWSPWRLGEAPIEARRESGQPERWSLVWTAGSPGMPETLELGLVDALGIANGDTIRFRIPSFRDQPPVATVVEPAADESVLPTAVLEVAVEGSDDVGLAFFGSVTRRTPSEGGDAEVVRDTTTADAGRRVRREETLDLAAIGAKAGDTLVIRAVAEDGFENTVPDPAAGAEGELGVRHPPVESPPRTIRVIPESELARQLRGQLSSLRRGAIRLDAQQAELAAASANDRFDAAGERGQAQVSERLRSAGEAIEAVERRSERNRLADDELAATLDQARDLVDAAERSSQEASAAMEERRAATGAEAAKAAGERATAAQERVREELEDLVRLLDRDEDAWAMGRDLERLRESLGQVRQETQELGRRTVGQSTDNLPANERSELERLTERQREAAASSRQLIDEMRKRADGLERADRNRAEAMRNAAQKGEEGRVAQKLEQAAAESGENRLQQAAQSQEEAAEALDEMQAALEDIRKARVEELKRALESLVQSIQRLVRNNEDELIALERLDAADVDAVADRARVVAKLAQNARAVAGEARDAGAEAGRIARVVDRAADNLGTATSALRKSPPELAAAKTAEERSLALLREALEAAEKTREEVEDREAERARRAILGEYRKLAERQVSVRDATVAARPADPTARLDRRALVESRRLSIAEAEIGKDLDAVAKEHEDVAKSAAFAEAHRLIGEWTSSASRRLQDGDLGERTVGEQDLVLETFAGLIEALNEAEPDRDPFEEPQEQEAGGEAGASGSGNDGVLPPIAELRLIRGLQQQALDRTRRLAGRDEAADPARADADRASIAGLQQKLVDLAAEVIKKMEPTQVAPEATIEPGPAPVPGYLSFRQETPVAPVPPSEATPPANPKPPEGGSLDDLLGIEGQTEGDSGGDSAAVEQAKKRLDRKLDEKELEGVLKQALDYMKFSSERIASHRDVGIDVQRAQQEAIDRLDILIEQAKKRRKSSSSSSSSSSQSRPQGQDQSQGSPQPSQPTDGSQRQDGTDGQATEPPPPEDGSAADRLLEESGEEWGRLPQRVRDLIRQGSRDRISTVYRRLTEEYYRRMAEDAAR